MSDEMSELEGRQFLSVSDSIELAQWVCERAGVDVDRQTIVAWWRELGATRYERTTYAIANRLIERAIAFHD